MRISFSTMPFRLHSTVSRCNLYIRVTWNHEFCELCLYFTAKRKKNRNVFILFVCFHWHRFLFSFCVCLTEREWLFLSKFISYFFLILSYFGKTDSRKQLHVSRVCLFWHQNLWVVLCWIFFSRFFVNYDQFSISFRFINLAWTFNGFRRIDLF